MSKYVNKSTYCHRDRFVIQLRSEQYIQYNSSRFRKGHKRGNAHLAYRSDKCIMYNIILYFIVFARETLWNFIPTTSCRRAIKYVYTLYSILLFCWRHGYGYLTSSSLSLCCRDLNTACVIL